MDFSNTDIAFLKTTPSMRFWNSLNSRSENSPVEESQNSDDMSPIPNDAVHPGSEYEVQPILWRSSGRTLLQVYVSHIYNPDHFYIQLMENAKSLDILNMEMQEFYNTKLGDSYKLLQDEIVVGCPVAAIYQNESDDQVWNRGLITGCQKEKGLIEIYYVDFGAKQWTGIDNIRMLKKIYFKWHAQAIRATLACVQPPDLETQWSSEVTKLMIDFVSTRGLFCEVLGLEGNSFTVILCDTSVSNQDIYFNDLLLKEKLAERAPSPYPVALYITQKCCWL